MASEQIEEMKKKIKEKRERKEEKKKREAAGAEVRLDVPVAFLRFSSHVHRVKLDSEDRGKIELNLAVEDFEEFFV